MGLLESIYTEATNVMKGINGLKSTQLYTIAYDKDHEILCWFYELNGLGLKLITEYYEHNGLNKFDIHIHNKNLKNRSPQVKRILDKKICILDDKLVTYEIVVKHAQTHGVKGYKPGKLRNTLNKFETIK